MHKLFIFITTALLLSQSAWAENNPLQLDGYDINRASAAFTQALRTDDNLFKALSQRPDLVKQLMKRMDLQNQLADKKITLTEVNHLLVKPNAAADLAKTPAGKKAAAEIAAMLNGRRSDVANTAAADLETALGTAANGSLTPTDETGLSAEEAAKRAREALENSGNTTPIITLPPTTDTLTDLNAIPEQGLDANGWPVYMHVPETCPAADPKLTYFHTFYASQRKGADPTLQELTQNTWVKSWFRTGGHWMYITMTDNETYAVPFMTPNTDHNDTLHIINDHGRPMNSEWSISECPGQFTNLPTGCFSKMSDMGINYVSRDSELRNPSGAGSCHLEPNKQYYMNFHTVGNSGCSGENALAQPDPNWPSRRGKDGLNHEVCNQTVDFGQQEPLLPPYTGVGLSQDPRPLNYYSGLGATNKPYYQWLCDTGANTAGAFGESFDMLHTCADPQDKLESTTYHYQCRSNQGRWVGDVKPAYSAYVCEAATMQTGESVAAALDRNQQRGDEHTVCARPREGQVRELRCHSVQHSSMHEGYRQQQCQYVPEANRYMWLTVSLTNVGLSNNHNLYSHAGDIACNNQLAQMPARQTCEFNGVQYPIGTQMTTTCAGKSLISECRTVGEDRHEQSNILPAFVRVSGATDVDPAQQISSQCSYTFN